MKAGDSVKHKIKPKYGIGKIISLYVSQGTAMVKFENLEETTYHVLWTLEKHESRWFAIRRDRTAPTPLEEAHRLALFVLRRNHNKCDKSASEMPEPLIYIGPKMVYGGINGDTAITEKAHHFVRPNGKRLYIYGDHIKHIRPFTRG